MSSMRYVHVSASGKINPALYVGDVREDGYHDLDIFFESLDIFDDIEVESNDSGEVTIEIRGEAAGVPADSTNLAVRAVQMIRERHAIAQGADMVVMKKIPVAGGMAGGSADAAGALLACNELWELGLSQEELMELGAELGADVPFCLLGSLARGSGKGERLRSIQPGYMHFWVLLTSREGLSTPQVFSVLDDIRSVRDTASLGEARAQADALEEALQGADMQAIGALMHNDLAEAALSLRPELGEIMKECAEFGVGTILSGAGPTIGILAESYEEADAIANHMRQTFPDCGVIRANGPAAGAHLRSVR